MERRLDASNRPTSVKPLPQHFIHTAASHLIAVFVAVNAASRFVDVRRRRVTAAAYHFVAVAPLFSLRRRRRVTAAASRFVAAAASHYLISSRAYLKSVITTCYLQYLLLTSAVPELRRQPYKVICDGTFVYHLIANQITPADNALATTLAASVKLFTTKCVIDELKGLGESHFEAVQAAHKLTIARCEHERKKNADACIMDVLGEKNLEHFFVATQDVDLRKKLQEVPGVPLIFGLRNALFLEQPSTFQRQFVKASEEGRSRITESEYKMLKKRAKGILETEEIRDSSNEGEDEDVGDQNLELQTVKKGDNARKQMGVKDKPQFKRKRAKGPNPLSCKKKKGHENPSMVSGKESKDGDNSVRSRNRTRKRSRKGKSLVEKGS
ncbi:hypothetical protein Q3G72_009060 [Acer saccharum]|nr:hypothetical protein Q3G72_009060 [Acer saccharum]